LLALIVAAVAIGMSADDMMSGLGSGETGLDLDALMKCFFAIKWNERIMYN